MTHSWHLFPCFQFTVPSSLFLPFPVLFLARTFPTATNPWPCAQARAEPSQKPLRSDALWDTAPGCRSQSRAAGIGSDGERRRLPNAVHNPGDWRARGEEVPGLLAFRVEGIWAGCLPLAANGKSHPQRGLTLPSTTLGLAPPTKRPGEALMAVRAREGEMKLQIFIKSISSV